MCLIPQIHKIKINRRNKLHGRTKTERKYTFHRKRTQTLPTKQTVNRDLLCIFLVNNYNKLNKNLPFQLTRIHKFLQLATGNEVAAQTSDQCKPKQNN